MVAESQGAGRGICSSKTQGAVVEYVVSAQVRTFADSPSEGTGKAGFKGDVAVKDGKILAVGSQLNMTGAREIDANGKIVAPCTCFMRN